MKKHKPLALLSASLAAWGLYSWTLMNRKPPPEHETLDYWRGLFSPLGLEHILDTVEITDLPREDFNLKLYLYPSSPEDPTVVFIPGTSVYAMLYGEFMYKLSQQGFNVLGYDCRGHGLSGGKRGSYTLKSLVEDTMEVVTYAIERFNQKVAVSGSSQGGILAFYTAAADPRLKSAICHNILAPDEPDNARLTRNPAVYSKITSLLPYTKSLIERVQILGEMRIPVTAYLNLKAESSKYFTDLYEFFRSDPLIVRYISLNALISLATTELARPVEGIETPIMVIHSGLDNIFPEDYIRRVFERLTCKKKLLYLPDTPHLVMTDYVDKIMEGVISWLNETLR